MNPQMRDWIWLIGSAGLSVVVFMGLWVMWLKTREPGFKKYAFLLGPLPLALMVVVISLRSGDQGLVLGYYQTSIAGPESGQGPITREIAFPVANATAPYMVEIQPVVQDVSVKAPNGEHVEASHAVIQDKRFVFFNGVGEGAYVLVIRVPAGVEKVDIVSMQNR